MNLRYIFPSGVKDSLKHFWDYDYIFSPSFLPSQPSPFTPPPQTCSSLSIVLCLEFRLHELSLFHISLSIGILLLKLLFREPCWWDFYVCSFTNICRRNNLTANSLPFWLYFFFHNDTFSAFFPFKFMIKLLFTFYIHICMMKGFCILLKSTSLWSELLKRNAQGIRGGTIVNSHSAICIIL